MAPSPLRATRDAANRWIRRTVGLNKEPPARCDDPALSYGPVEGVARLVNGDLASMLVGGIASLFFQMLHPLAMAGVDQHSRYRDDPLERLRQTAEFIGVTTYGTRVDAARAIERVRAVHEGVRGTDDDGRPYAASDSHLLSFVHCAETSMFLRGYERFGASDLAPGEADAYVAEMAPVATDLGVTDAPRSVAELDARLAAFRPELRLSRAGRAARDFIAHDIINSTVAHAGFSIIVHNAYDLLEPWARDLLEVREGNLLVRGAWRGAGHLLSAGLRLAVPPAARQVSDSPPSTATT